MAITDLLSPSEAVQLAWALSSEFNTEERSKMPASEAKSNIKLIKSQAQTSNNPQQQKYVSQAIASIYASLRSLDIVYKGRNLNFDDNEKLRQAFLDGVKQDVDFGTKAKDIVRSLPAMVLGGAGGLTVGQITQNLFGLTDILLGALFLAGIGISYPAYAVYVRYKRKQKLQCYIAQDYERNLYYYEYVERVETILTELYDDLNSIHQDVFQAPYQNPPQNRNVVTGIIKGLKSNFCENIHRHMKEKSITPELWSICEAGNKIAIQCCPNNHK